MASSTFRLRGFVRPFALVALAVSPAAAVPYFSVDAGSPSVPDVDASDVLEPGPVGGPPGVAAPASALGLGAFGEELDAMTGGGSRGMVHFSVDRFSVGAQSAVFHQASRGQAAGDVFLSADIGVEPRPELNGLGFNQDILGELPPVVFYSNATVAPPIDALDALDLGGALPGFFALAVGHPHLGASGLMGCGADLFGPGPAPLVAFGALGLASCDDDIDALHLDTDSADFYYSLAPGSPSLLPGSPIVGCSGGCSAADLFVAPGGFGPSVLAAPAAALGLLPSDNIDALAWQTCPAPIGDFDGDGVDDACDNCLALANATQWDIDADGFGNSCDADYDQDGDTDGTDFLTVRIGFYTKAPIIDHNDDGTVDGRDWIIFRAFFLGGAPPGPSALSCAGSGSPCTH